MIRQTQTRPNNIHRTKCTLLINTSIVPNATVITLLLVVLIEDLESFMAVGDDDADYSPFPSRISLYCICLHMEIGL